jgi:hypothetical protein
MNAATVKTHARTETTKARYLRPRSSFILFARPL